MKIISYLLDLFHIVFILSPIIIFFIPTKYFYLTKIIILILFLTPLHWSLFNNKCLLTVFSQKLGGLSESNTGSAFTEKYLKHIYEFFFRLFNIKKNNKNLNKFVSIQWIVMYILVFYYIFYYLDCKKI